MLTFLYYLRLVAAAGALGPTLASVPIPAFQITAGVLAGLAEIATIILDRAPKITALVDTAKISGLAFAPPVVSEGKNPQAADTGTWKS